MYEVMKRRRMAVMGIGAFAAFAASAVGAPVAEGLLPEPKPPKELTDADRERIEAAAERRKRRAAKWAGRG